MGLPDKELTLGLGSNDKPTEPNEKDIYRYNLNGYNPSSVENILRKSLIGSKDKELGNRYGDKYPLLCGITVHSLRQGFVHIE